MQLSALVDDITVYSVLLTGRETTSQQAEEYSGANQSAVFKIQPH